MNAIVPQPPLDRGTDLLLDGIRWTLSAEGDRLLSARELTLKYLIDESRSKRVKHGPHRSVYRVELASTTAYLKQSRVWTWRSFVRELIRGPKAKLEFDRATLLLGRGIPTAVPLAWGRRDSRLPSESYLLTRELPQTEQLNQFLERTFSAADDQAFRGEVATALGRFLARMHDAGITHTDLHPGNLLIHRDRERIDFYLLDLHDLGVGGPLSFRKAKANLAVFNRWFLIRASRTDRLRFWRAYAKSRRFSVEEATRIESETWSSNQRFWRSRDQRCTKNNRYFQTVRGSGVRGFAVKEIDPDFLQSLLKNPDVPFDDPRHHKLKDSRSSTVVEMTVPTPTGPRTMVFKRFRVTKWTDGLANFFRSSPTLRSWRFGHGLPDRGLSTARPWLVLHRRRYGLAWEGYLLCEKIENANDLQIHFKNSTTSSRGDLIDRLARLIRRLHQSGLSHRDLKASNLLVTPEGKIHFIDLVGVAVQRQVSRAVRVQNLARLNANFSAPGSLTRSERLRFLQLYLNDSLHPGSNWRNWWREIAQATREKIERNRKRGRPLA